MASEREPLLSKNASGASHRAFQSSSIVFETDTDDIQPICSIGDFYRYFMVKSKKLWYIACPCIFISISQYTLSAIPQSFAGQLGTIPLAAISVENSVIAGFSFNVMLGMGSTLETLCGQAYEAGQLDMLDIYLKRSWIILLVAVRMLTPLYIFVVQLLRLIGQTEEIAMAADTFSIWMIPQIFAYAVYFPVVKFLHVQSRDCRRCKVKFSTKHRFKTHLP